MSSNNANRLGLDYLKEAAGFAHFPFPIIDSHTHINGLGAVKLYKKAAEAYGVGLTYSMTQLEQIPVVKEIMGDRIRFIAMPKFTEEERYYGDIAGYMKHIEAFYAHGARIIKFWSAPRSIDYGKKCGKPDLLKLNSPRRLEIMKQAGAMGMLFMVHVGDPDTWFQTRYLDSGTYGLKSDHYRALGEILEKFDVPVIAAHMGGWPEDLKMLSSLLGKYPRLYLDTSATKWMVRELSRHSRDELVDFFTMWKGRILFGSDIVSNEDHMQLVNGTIRSEDEVMRDTFDLYSSRYWALRTLLEKNYNEESPIADPDLAMVDPEKYSESDAPILSGKFLPLDLLESIYYKAANKLLEPYHK